MPKGNRQESERQLVGRVRHHLENVQDFQATAEGIRRRHNNHLQRTALPGRGLLQQGMAAPVERHCRKQ